MNIPETITGTEAIRRMRLVSETPDFKFKMIFITCNLKKETGGELRKVENARLRVALRQDTYETDGDLYLPYTDCDLKEARMCFKKLIRMVAFPPNYEWMQVKWFE